MMLAAQTQFVFSESVPTWAVYALAVTAVCCWMGTHWLKRLIRIPLLSAAAFVVRVAVGLVAMLAVSQAILRGGLAFATNWSLWPLALAGALCIEVVLALYAMERRTVSRPLGIALAGLRVLLVALVILMLSQPIKPWITDKTITRFVAVLLDNSASMYVSDTQMTASEKVQLAQRFSADSATHRHPFDGVAEDMDHVRSDMATHSQWLATLSSASGQERLKVMKNRREGLSTSLAEADKKLAALASAMARPLDPKIVVDARLRAAAEEVNTRLATLVRENLKDAITVAGKDNAENLDRDHGRLLRDVTQLVAGLAELSSKAAAVSLALDEASYALLTPEEKSRVDTVASEKRLAVARDVLLKGMKRANMGGKTTGLLDLLKEKWTVSMYEFAAKPAQVNLPDWSDPAKDVDHLASVFSDLPAPQQQTDMALAVETVMTDMADKRLSGILLLTDGRSNGPRSVEPLVQRLGAGQIPVSSIVFGSSKPTMDAGVVSVQAPEAVNPKDRVLITAEIKLDGLAGKEARVTLSDGGKVVDSKTVKTDKDAYRTHVDLGADAATKGLHTYTIEVQGFEGEIVTANNKYPVTVNVNEERVNVLLIDGRPRWEFRYLKNLFAGRDRNIRLQYVLLEPDRLEGVALPPKIEASASRPDGEAEANALPKDETEWMKFDVIILGDVDPKFLGDEELKILERFVKIRSGSLIVISGPQHMPHNYVGTPLADLLPVVVRKEEKLFVAPPEMSFHIALTAEGRASPMLEQKTAEEDNAKVWDSLPEIYWRHPVLRTLQGATVLAYALPTLAPDYLPRRGAAPEGEKLTDELLRQRVDFERANPLIVYHTVATGQVMWFGFDHTWRLRYLTGDTYHHRLWGQVLRWAGTIKLPSGTETVRLGAERFRYASGDTVRVRARIAKKDFSPINKADDVSVKVFADDVLILTRKMEYIERSPGMYLADLGAMPKGGAFRIELVAPQVKETLAQQKVARVETEFSVDPTATTTTLEQGELVPDRGLLQRLANMTGGVVADPSHADRVLASLGAPTETENERHEYRLWDDWPLLLLIIAVATVEWLLRKKGGLA